MLCKYLQTLQKRVGCSLKQAYSKGKLVSSRIQAAYQFSVTEICLFGLKRVSRSLLKQNSSCGNRQHHSGVIYKQGRRQEVGLTVCSAALDLVCQETSDSKPDTFQGRLNETANKLSKVGQTIQTVVSPSRGLLVNFSAGGTSLK